MKKLLTVLSVIFVILLVLIIAVVAAAYFYVRFYLAPKAADFEFYKPSSEITSIEIVEVKKVSDTEIELTAFARVEDVDAFLADFKALKCTKGLSISAITTLAKLDGISAVKINYGGNDFEIITPYGNLNSGILSPDLTLNQLMSEEYFFFDEAEFSALIAEYAN